MDNLAQNINSEPISTKNSINSFKNEASDKYTKDSINDVDIDEIDMTSSHIKGQSTLLPSNTQNFTKEMLTKAAQSFVTNINSKRKQDSLLMDEFKKALQEYAVKCSKTIEDHYFQIYESTGKVIQDKVQTLFNSLENITRYENEIKEFKEDIESVLKSIQNEFSFD